MAFWSTAFEKALFQFNGIPFTPDHSSAGRGTPQVLMKLPSWARCLDRDGKDQAKHSVGLDLPLHGQMLRLMRTVTHMASLVNVHRPVLGLSLIHI
eukprot:14821767-Alexandrium_andersonii.AAC.1